ncbi:YdiU family protein [Silanimonas algicola]
MHLDTAPLVSGLPGESSLRPGSRDVLGVVWSATRPTPVPAPRWLALSNAMADELGIDAAQATSPALLALLAGNAEPDHVVTVATNYGGHQFGHWAGQLGDGRALLLGAAAGRDGQRWEVQLKGAGPTPYSRRADGRAVLRSSLREYVASETMHALGVPTTRALSLVAPGGDVVRDLLYSGDPKPEPGAIVCRVAPSFLRFGHYELPASRGDRDLLERLVDHTIATHFPQLSGPNARADWFAEVARRTGVLMAHWMRVGFVHGVMNTDNLSVLGLTIDYGPFGFLDDADPHWTPNTTDLPGRRYRYAAQPQVAHWNLSALASALAPLFPDAAPLTAGMNAYVEAFQSAQARMWADKLGLEDWRDEDAALVSGLFAALQAAEVDFTLFFRTLGEQVGGAGANGGGLAAAIADPVAALAPALYDTRKAEREAATLRDWLLRYGERLASDPQRPEARRVRMDAANPWVVPRNWLLQQAIDAAERGDTAELHALLDVLQRPYEVQPGAERFAGRRPDWAKDRPGCSALSCSS